MSHLILKHVALPLALVTTLVAAVHAESGTTAVPAMAKYQQECAACHVAYPPGLLPAASWQRIMNSLNKHYGADASLDQTSAVEIGAWLKTHAGKDQRTSEEPPQDRITKSAWFLRKHRAGEVPSEVWKRAAVGSAANCGACHRNAAHGSFSEREIKIPK